jgi:radical SAM protein with 4Fe4S-binding SPASM domain
MTKRRIKKALKRAIYLPRGLDFIRYVSNKIYSFYLRKTKSLKVAHPSTVMLEVTNHCNLHCITCPREYDYGKKMDKGYMDFDKFKQTIDELYPYVDSVGLTGLGETLLYTDIVNAVDYIKNKSKGIIVSCSINAHLPDSVEYVRQLANKIDTIQISMDGLGEIYNKIRVGGNFDFFKSNLEKIVELTRTGSTDIMINVVIVKENYHQMSDIVDFVAGMSIGYLNMIPINLVAKTDEDISYYKFFFTEEYISAALKAKKQAAKYKNLEFILSELSTDNGFKSCPYPWNYFYVSWDGYLPPCCAKPFPKELNFGNVFENGLMKSLNSEGFMNFRKMWYKNKTPDFCRKCSADIDL